MIIHRKKSAIYFQLFIAIGFGGLIIAAFIENEWKFNFFYLMYCFFSIYYISQAIYTWITPLVQIDKNSITFYTFPSKKQTYDLVDIHVEYKVGDYKFKTTGSKTYTIVKSSILKSQLDEFESLIKDIQEKQLNSENLATS